MKWKDEEWYDFYNEFIDCRQKEIKQAYFRCVDEVKEILLKDKKELAKSEQCLFYMDLNEYKESTENDIKDILKVYVDDLKEQIEKHESEMKTYLSESKKY